VIFPSIGRLSKEAISDLETRGNTCRVPRLAGSASYVRATPDTYQRLLNEV